jgi:hypothetical protein
VTLAADTQPLVPRGLILGVVIVVVGAVFLADSLGMLDAQSGWAMWPLAVIVAGLIVRLQPGTANDVTGVILLIAGVWLLFNELGIWTYALWRTWPLVLILLGTWMLYRTRHMRQRAGGPEGYDQPRTAAQHVGAFVFLSRIARQTMGQQLRSGEITVLGGECAFDVTDVARGADPVVIDAFVIAGRIRITVPPGWVVRQRVLPLLGRVSDDEPAAAIGMPIDLLIQGTAILGAIDVMTPAVDPLSAAIQG